LKYESNAFSNIDVKKLLKTGEIRNKYRTAILVSIPALLVLLLAGTAGLFPQTYAAVNPQVNGSCTTAATCGTVSCVAGPVNGPVTITFTAKNTAGVVTGTFSIAGTVTKTGTINSLKFDNDTDSYTIKGIETFEAGCAFPQTLPSTVTISGYCGTSVTIKYKAANGETGKFVGSVACVALTHPVGSDRSIRQIHRPDW
jgi:hypothetical protein